MTTAAELLDQVPGDATGLMLPAHPAALAAAGAGFLTTGFRAFGSLGEDNAVARIVRCEPCPGGSTGAKLLLEVDYARADPALHRHLFVEFSRDFADPRRDWQRTEMQSEAPFMAVRAGPASRSACPPPISPTTTPRPEPASSSPSRCPTATGDRAAPAQDARPCHDGRSSHLLSGGRNRAGAARGDAPFGAPRADIDARFPFEPVTGSADPIRYSTDELEAELERCRSFARRCPQLLPAEIRSDAASSVNWRAIPGGSATTRQSSSGSSPAIPT